MDMVTVTYKGKRYDVNLSSGRVTLWWIQGNRWGQDIYRFRDIAASDPRYAAVIEQARNI